MSSLGITRLTLQARHTSGKDTRYHKNTTHRSCVGGTRQQYSNTLGEAHSPTQRRVPQDQDFYHSVPWTRQGWATATHWARHVTPYKTRYYENTADSTGVPGTRQGQATLTQWVRRVAPNNTNRRHVAVEVRILQGNRNRVKLWQTKVLTDKTKLLIHTSICIIPKTLYLN